MRELPMAGALSALLALAACSAVPAPPTQPSMANILAVQQELAAEQVAGLTPLQALEYGILGEQRACDAWLEASASRANKIANAQNALSNATGATAGIMGILGAGGPAVAGAAVGGTFLGNVLTTQAGAGLSDGDAYLIANALQQYEANLSMPTDLASASLQIEGAWMTCNQFAANQYGERAKLTAQVTASSPVSSSSSLSQALQRNAGLYVLPPVPVVQINGH
jgi:hypothetical protein